MNRVTKTIVLVAACLLGLFGCNEKASNDYLVYDFRGKYGYVDRKGNVVIEPQFDNAKSFSEGLAWAEKDGKSGYIDCTGTFVIELDALDGEPFTEGLARVRMNRKDDLSCVFDIINNKGELIVDGQQFDYDYFTCFNPGFDLMPEGMAVVKKDGKYGVLDNNGNQIVAPKFDHCRGFSDGLAWVKTEGKWGCIDKNGKMVINTDFVRVCDFKEGLAFVCKEDTDPICIDKKGSVVIDKLPEGLKMGNWRFSEGMACVEINDKYGYIDKTGKMVIEPQFRSATEFSDGLALISNEKGQYGYIDKTGTIVIQPIYEDAEKFSEGFAVVCLHSETAPSEKKYFYIDKIGKMLIDSSFCEAKSFHNGIAEATNYDEGFINYIDKNGKILVNRNLSHLEKLFCKGRAYRIRGKDNSIREILLDNELREAFIEKYGKKWYDVLKNLEWRTRCSVDYYKEHDCYICTDYTNDEKMMGELRYYPETNEITSELYFFENSEEWDFTKKIRIMPDGKAWCGNWEVDYFVNEFNEKDYNYPFVYITLSGVYTLENWDLSIRIIYSDNGFIIEQEKELDYNKDIIIRRDSDGEIVRVPYKKYGAG